MGQALFLATVCAICVGWWLTVYAAPWTLSMLMPRGGLVFTIGFAFFAFGIAGAAIAVYAYASPTGFVGALLMAFWGGWLMLAPSAALRSSPQDIDMMERLGLMLVALMCVLVLSFYTRSTQVIAGLQLWLVLLGAVIATKGVQRRQRRQRR
jgi:hypothetical protein